MITLEDFEVALSKKKFKLDVWTLPDYRFELSRITGDKWFLHIFDKTDNDEVEIMNVNNIHFEIHYEPNEQILDVYFWDGKNGRYLTSKTDVFDVNELDLNIGRCIFKKFNVMKELFARHVGDTDTVERVVEEESFKETTTKDYSFCFKDEFVIISGKKYFEHYGKLSDSVVNEEVVKILNDNGFFILSGNTWQNDGRYFSNDLMEVELTKLGFFKSELMEVFVND